MTLSFLGSDFLILSQWAELLVGRSFPVPRRRGMAAHHGCRQVLWATCSSWSTESGPLRLCTLLHRLRARLQSVHVCVEVVVVVQFQLSFLNFLVDCQRPWGLISHLWVSLPLRIFPSAAFHLAQVKLHLPAFPFQKYCSVCFGSSRLCWLWLHVLWLLTHSPAGHLYLIPKFSLSSAPCSSAKTLLPHNT